MDIFQLFINSNCKPFCRSFVRFRSNIPVNLTFNGHVSDKLDEMLAYGASVNMYMFHGGSNFGYTSGAKGNKDASNFVPHTTSYDYDAPLNEAGDTTLKYWDIRAVNRL